MQKSVFIFASILFLFSCASSRALEAGYPAEWWAPGDPVTAPSWEILPQQAGPGEVILSKRTELGVFSNFAATPIKLDGVVYASVEGFWQMMKYPDDKLADDPRSDYAFPHTREEVGQLTSFDAKHAGDAASQIMTKLNINWVTYLGLQMTYHTYDKGAHYFLIRRAMKAKLEQTKGLKELLLRTGNLTLKPDHTDDTYPAWQYYTIWMEFRDELNSKNSN